MQNDLNPPPKRRTALVLAMGLIATIMVGVLSTMSPNPNAQTGSIRGAGDSVDVCSLLGIDYGDKPGTVIGTQGAHAEYFTYDMGVSSTFIERGTSIDEINQGVRAAGTDIHILRFSNDYGSMQSIAAKIEEIMSGVDAPGTILVMPGNEPGSEWRRYKPGLTDGDAWQSASDASPEFIAQKLDELINILEGSSNPEVRDTKNYLVFPATNIEKPDGPTYVSGEREAAGIAAAMTHRDAFFSYAVSVQHTTPGSDFSREIDKFKNGLGSMYNGNLILFGVAGGAKGFDEGAYDSLQAAIEKYKSEISGIYFFSPWGWQGDANSPTNPPFDLDIWDKLFTDCDRGDSKCGLTDYNDLPGLKACERIENDDVRSGVPLKRLPAAIDGKEFEAHIVVTQKVTGFGLLKWLSSSNYADDSNPPNGTSSNPYLPPCAEDLQISNDDPFGFVDMSNTFRGPILLKNSDREFEYQMPQLGNAVACLIWRMNNYQPGSKSPTELAKGFRSESPSAPRISNKQFEELLAKFEAPSKSPVSQDGPYCGGIVDRIDDSDKVSGEEIIIQDDILVLSRAEVCDRIKQNQIDVGSEANKKRVCVPTAANPNGVYKEVAGINPFVPVESKTTDLAEIPGLLEGLKQIYIAETTDFPWQSQYKVIHRDKAGIRLSTQKRLYDGLARKTRGASYSSPLTSGGSPSCEVRKYDGGLKAPTIAGGKVSGRADHIFPFVGQTPKMMARISRTFSRVTDKNYIQTKKNELRTAETRYKQATTTKDRQDALAALEKMITKQDDLFLCNDLDVLAGSINDTGLNEIIEHTDCMGTKSQTDPFAAWLCAQDGVFTPQEKAIFCRDLQCLAPTDYENAIELKLEDMKGKLTFPVGGASSFTGSYSTPDHPGSDVGAAQGTPVVATADGVVIYARNKYKNANDSTWIQDSAAKAFPMAFWAEYGNMVVIDHGDFYSLYAHLDFDSFKAREGQVVNAGDQIAAIGSTGKSTGPHLHFEIRVELNGEICPSYGNEQCTEDPRDYFSDESPTTPTAPRERQDVKVCKDSDIANIKYDNLCQLLERHEEITGMPKYLTAAILSAESSARSSDKPGRPFFTGDPYEVSHTKLNKECADRLASPTAIGCDCRGPGGWCVTGMQSIGSGICEGINVWYQYGVPDESEFDVGSIPIDYDENGNWRGGQCIKNGKVTFGVGNAGTQGNNYAETLECVQGLGMNVQYGDLLDRTRVGDTICAMASRANRSPGEWNEARIRAFSASYYGQAGFYDNKIWRLYNEYKAQWDNSCVMFSNN